MFVSTWSQLLADYLYTSFRNRFSLKHQNENSKCSTNHIPEFKETPPTEDGSGWNGLFVDPE